MAGNQSRGGRDTLQLATTVKGGKEKMIEQQAGLPWRGVALLHHL